MTNAVINPVDLTADEGTINAVVENIVTEADGVVSLYLASPVQGALPNWEPGAHIDLYLDNDLVRQYSLCGNPESDNWRVAVLREPKSRGGSQFLHESLNVGDEISCSVPRNNFALEDAEEYLFIAGGIGITPLLPMIAECERRGATWSMAYGGRNADSMAFMDDLKVYGSRVSLWPQDERGLIDLPNLLGAPRPGLAVYCCGPGVLLDAVECLCGEWPEGSGTLHLERFRPKEGALDGTNSAFEVVLDSTGESFVVEADRSIVETLEAAGYHVPTSCREGTCGTCETGVLEGTPEHRDSYLTPEEKASNEVMMLCCSRACGNRLVFDL